MRRRSVILPLCSCLPFLVCAQAGRDFVSITSISKQFILEGPRQTASPNAVSRAPGLIFLDPPLLSVTCERIKQAMQKELGWADVWRGRIVVMVHPITTDNEDIVITSSYSPGGWSYYVELPDEIETSRLIKGIVNVLLLEYANRGAGSRSAELPPWLGEGLAAYLESGPLSNLVVPHSRATFRQTPSSPARLRSSPRQAERSPALAGIERIEGLQQLKAQLRANPLTVDRLNWPEATELEGESGQFYEASAHLFVRELLRLRDAQHCFDRMLVSLRKYFNWQTAFVRAFYPHFSTMLEVEKWWALALYQFTGRGDEKTWPLAESREKLDEVLYTRVQVRFGKSELPHESNVALQSIINDWDYQKQERVLRQKMNHLAALRWRVAAEVMPLIDDYRAALQKYLEARRTSIEERALKNPVPPSAKVIAWEAVKELNALDQRRAQLWKKKQPPGALSEAVPLTGEGPNL